MEGWEGGGGDKELEFTKFPLQALLHKSLTTKQQQPKKQHKQTTQ